jgi:hypothetical protein
MALHCQLSRVAHLWIHTVTSVEWPPGGTTLFGGVLLVAEPQYFLFLQSVRQALQRPRLYESRHASNGAHFGVTHLLYESSISDPHTLAR